MNNMSEAKAKCESRLDVNQTWINMLCSQRLNLRDMVSKAYVIYPAAVDAGLFKDLWKGLASSIVSVLDQEYSPTWISIRP